VSESARTTQNRRSEIRVCIALSTSLRASNSWQNDGALIERFTEVLSHLQSFESPAAPLGERAAAVPGNEEFASIDI
jgi:hypothetical protein